MQNEKLLNNEINMYVVKIEFILLDSAVKKRKQSSLNIILQIYEFVKLPFKKTYIVLHLNLLVYSFTI